MAEFVSTYGLYAAYILIGLAVLLAIILPLISAFSNPKSLIGTVGGIVLIAVIFFIGWSISSDEVTNVYTRFGITEASSKMVGGALISMYILIGLALISILFSEVTKIFR